jgi:hypothetical protein
MAAPKMNAVCLAERCGNYDRYNKCTCGGCQVATLVDASGSWCLLRMSAIAFVELVPAILTGLFPLLPPFFFRHLST